MTHIHLAVYFTAIVVTAANAVQYNPNPTSEMSADDKKTIKTSEISDESSHEIEMDDDTTKEKKFLDDAMKTVLDPTTTLTVKTDNVLQSFKFQLEVLDNASLALDVFMKEMDKLSLDICKTSQETLWSYVTDISNEDKKNTMVRIAAEEDEIKKQYWNILKKNYLSDQLNNDPKFKRKLRIIKERGTNVQMPQSKQREEIDTMQKIWSRVTVCAYNSTCDSEDSMRTLTDIISIFKTSSDSKELKYYWASYRDATGKKVRPIFKDYVERMNVVALSENFTDAAEMWRYAFEDDDFVKNVARIWHEIKPFYDLLHDYVRLKLKTYYNEELKGMDKTIPSHLLGNLWAQEWQSIFSKVVSYPAHTRPVLQTNAISSRDLFDAVDDFHQSLGFESSQDSYRDIRETATTANCLPSSHDMCDGINYKIKWCGETVSDVVVGLSRAARLLGHVQYFKHYKNLPPLYRDGPNPAFHDAVSDIVAIQLIIPEHLKSLGLTSVDTGPQVTLNHLLWVALEKVPLMAYAYVLDKWRWDVFGNSSLENWNEHWWDLRIKETGVSAPVPRNESDLDPAAKYHVVSHVQYITYLISHVLEFQILLSLCTRANHTGPLHECSIYGVKEAGRLLSDGMSLGASKDWRTVLQTMTGESELSTQGILSYFKPLQDFLQTENIRLASIENDMDKSAPMIVGAVALFLFFLILVLYCVKKRDSARKMLSVCGLSKNGSLDIATNDMPRKKRSETEGVSEDKV